MILLSNKGNVKDCDRKSFLFNEISKITWKFLNLENRDSNKWKKNLLSNKIVKNNNIDSDSDSDSVIEIRVNFTRRASIRKRVFFHQRKLSSHIILADIFNFIYLNFLFNFLIVFNNILNNTSHTYEYWKLLRIKWRSLHH